LATAFACSDPATSLSFTRAKYSFLCFVESLSCSSHDVTGCMPLVLVSPISLSSRPLRFNAQRRAATAMQSRLGFTDVRLAVEISSSDFGKIHTENATVNSSEKRIPQNRIWHFNHIWVLTMSIVHIFQKLLPSMRLKRSTSGLTNLRFLTSGRFDEQYF
jgi:hypothetical protein